MTALKASTGGVSFNEPWDDGTFMKLFRYIQAGRAGMLVPTLPKHR